LDAESHLRRLEFSNTLSSFLPYLNKCHSYSSKYGKLSFEENICHTNDSQTQQFYYNLLSPGYMFRLLGVILRPSIEPNQDCLITSPLSDPVALTIGGVNVVWNYSLVFTMTVVSAGTGLFCGCNDGFKSRRGASSCHAFYGAQCSFVYRTGESLYCHLL
jgi:hypothetical protein